jgi:plasmid stabilization system protein ParE
VKLQWTSKALLDVERLCLFLAQHDRDAANRLANTLNIAAAKLTSLPRLGERVDSYVVREVRKFSVGRYVMHYELRDDEIIVLRIWHGREDRR